MLSRYASLCVVFPSCAVTNSFDLPGVRRGFNPPLVEDDPTMATEKRRKGREGKGGKGKTRKGSDGNEDWGIGSVGKD